MIRFVYLLSLILLKQAYSANSQHFLVLKNGERLQFKRNSVSASKTEVKIKSEAKGKLIFKPEEVVGYYSIKDESTFYLKPEVGDSGQLTTYDFLDKILVGEINLYKKFIAGSPSGPNSAGSASMTFLYLEKGDNFQPLGLITYHIFGNKSDENKRIEILKSFVSDRPDLIAAIEAEDFKPNEENISKVLIDYNLSKYKRNENSTNSPSSVFFYLKGKVTKPVKLFVDDRGEYNLSTASSTAIKLPINQYTKVCVNSYCEVLESSPWYILYFEVEINEKKGKIEINRSTSLNANLYFRRKYEVKKEDNF